MAKAQRMTLSSLRGDPRYLKSVILSGNGKLLDYDDPETGERFRYMQFSTRALHDCPFASDGCKAICYATKGNHNFPSVKTSRARAKADSMEDDFSDRMIYTIRAEQNSGRYSGAHTLFRLHESGDFYSLAYLRKWVRTWADFRAESFITFVFYTKSFPLFLLLDDSEAEIVNDCLRRGVIAMSLSLDDTTTPEQMTAALRVKARFPLANIYRCTEDIQTVDHDNECDCADCAKCGKCNHGTGEVTVVKIHSAGEADLKTYREKSRKAS